MAQDSEGRHQFGIGLLIVTEIYLLPTPNSSKKNSLSFYFFKHSIQNEKSNHLLNTQNIQFVYYVFIEKLEEFNAM